MAANERKPAKLYQPCMQPVCSQLQWPATIACQLFSAAGLAIGWQPLKANGFSYCWLAWLSGVARQPFYLSVLSSPPAANAYTMAQLWLFGQPWLGYICGYSARKLYQLNTYSQ